MKTCKKCGKAASKSEFYRHPHTRDGRQGVCKECHKQRVRDNRAANVEYYREYDRMRYQTDPSVRKRLSKVTAKWTEAHPDRKAAHTAVRQAIQQGRLTRPATCEDCGQEHQWIHGHHEDYTKPLDVIWVCPPCHRARHLGDD